MFNAKLGHLGNSLERLARTILTVALVSSCAPPTSPSVPARPSDSGPRSLTVLRIDGLSHAAFADYLQSLTSEDRASSALARLLSVETDSTGSALPRTALFVPDGAFQVSTDAATDPASSTLPSGNRGYTGPDAASTPPETLTATLGTDFGTPPAFRATGTSDAERFAALAGWGRARSPDSVVIHVDTIPGAVRRHGPSAIRPSLRRIDSLLQQLEASSKLLDVRERYVVLTSEYGLRPAAAKATVISVEQLAAASGSSEVVPLGGFALIRNGGTGKLAQLRKLTGIDTVLLRDGPGLYSYSPELGTHRPVTLDELDPRVSRSLLRLTHPGDVVAVIERDGCGSPAGRNCFTAEPGNEAETYLIKGGLSAHETNVPFFIVGPDTSYSPLPLMAFSDARVVIRTLATGAAAADVPAATAAIQKISDSQYRTRHPDSIVCEASDPASEQSCERLLLQTRDRAQAASAINRILTARELDAEQRQALAGVSAWLSAKQRRAELPAAVTAEWPSQAPRCSALDGIVDLTGKTPECNLRLAGNLPESLRQTLAVAIADFAGGNVALAPGQGKTLLAVASTPTLRRWLGPRYISSIVTRDSAGIRSLESLAIGLRNYEEGSLADAQKALTAAASLPGAAAEWRDLFLEWASSDLGAPESDEKSNRQAWMGLISKARDVSLAGLTAAPGLDQELAKLGTSVKGEASGIDAQTHGERSRFAEALASIRKVQFPSSGPCSVDVVRRRVVGVDPPRLVAAAAYFEQLGQPGLAADAYIRLAYTAPDTLQKNNFLERATDQLKRPAAGWIRWSIALRILNLFAEDPGTVAAREHVTRFLLDDAQRRLPLVRDPSRVADNVVVPLLAAGIDPARIKASLRLAEFPRPPIHVTVKRIVNTYLDPLALMLQVTDLKGLSTRLFRSLSALDVLYPDRIDTPTTSAEYTAAVAYLLARAGKSYFDGSIDDARVDVSRAAKLALAKRQLAAAQPDDAALATLVGVLALASKAALAKEASAAIEDADQLLGVLGEMVAGAVEDVPQNRGRLARQIETMMPAVGAAAHLLLTEAHGDASGAKTARLQLVRSLARPREHSSDASASQDVEHYLDVVDILVKDILIAISPADAALRSDLRRATVEAKASAVRLKKTWHPSSTHGRYLIQALLAGQDVVADWQRLDGWDSMMRAGYGFLNLGGEIAADIDRTYSKQQRRQLLEGTPDLFQLAAVVYRAYYDAVNARKPRNMDGLASVLASQTGDLLSQMASSDEGGVAKILLAFLATRWLKDEGDVAKAIELGRRWSRTHNMVPDALWELATARDEADRERGFAALQRFDRIAEGCPAIAADLLKDKAYIQAELGDYAQAAQTARASLTRVRYQGGANTEGTLRVESRSEPDVINAQLVSRLGVVRSRKTSSSYQLGLGVVSRACCTKDGCTPCEPHNGTSGTLSLAWLDSTRQAAIRAGLQVSLYLLAAGAQEDADSWLGNVPDLYYGRDPIWFSTQQTEQPPPYEPGAALIEDPVTLLWLGVLAELNGFIGHAEYYFGFAKREAENLTSLEKLPTHSACEIDDKADVLTELARCEEPLLLPRKLVTADFREIVHARVLALPDRVRRGNKYVALVRKYRGEFLPAWAGGVAASVMKADSSQLDDGTPQDIGDRIRVRYGTYADEYASNLAAAPCEGVDALLVAARRGDIPLRLLSDLLTACGAAEPRFRAAQLVASSLDRKQAFDLWIMAAAQLRVAPDLGNAEALWMGLIRDFWFAPDEARATSMLSEARESRMPAAMIEALAFLHAARASAGEPFSADPETVALLAQGYGLSSTRQFLQLLGSGQPARAQRQAAQTFLREMTPAGTAEAGAH